MDKIKAEREAFNNDGDPPKSIPAKEYKREEDAARATLDAAYAAAVAAYTKSKTDDKAAAVAEDASSSRRTTRRTPFRPDPFG